MHTLLGLGVKIRKSTTSRWWPGQPAQVAHKAQQHPVSRLKDFQGASNHHHSFVMKGLMANLVAHARMSANMHGSRMCS